MTPVLRILHLEDDNDDARLVLGQLEHAGLGNIEQCVVTTEAAFRDAIIDSAPDAILADVTLPSFDGMDALEIAQTLRPDIPFIFVSGTIAEKHAVEALKRGASDYVLKSSLLRLPAALERALADARERAQRRQAETELDQTRHQLNSVMGSLDAMVWSMAHPSQRMLYVSPAVETLFGHSAQEFVATPDLWLQAIHPDDRDAVRQARQAIANGAPFDAEYRIVHANGNLHWVHDHARLVPGAKDQPERIDGILRNITGDVEQRRRIARLSRVRDLFASVSSTMLRMRDRQATFDEAVRIAVEVGQFTSAWIGLLNPLTQRLVCAAHRGKHPEYFDSILMSTNDNSETGRGIVGRSLRSGHVEIRNDLAHDANPRQRDQHLSLGVHAAASFPLIVDGKAIGTLLLHAAEPGAFDDEELRLLNYVVGDLCFVLELQAKQEQLHRLAYYDALTGLPNRTLFKQRLEQRLDFARRSNGTVALVLLDLHRFNAINDTHGHYAGDQLLQQFASRLQEFVNDQSRLARMPGDQFALYFVALKDQSFLDRAIERAWNQFVSTPFPLGDKQVHLSARGGVALYPNDGRDADELLRNAEAALKKAKQSGERLTYYAPHINARVAQQLELETRLRGACEKDEFVLHFQPKVNLAANRISGFEALLRWQDPQAGLIAPEQFIAALEDTGLIVPVGRWVLEEVVRALPALGLAGFGAMPVAVNVSPVQLHERAFVDDVRALLNSTEGLRQRIEIEITESIFLDDLAESEMKLRSLRDLGIRVAIDDFGTGFSSLAYLSKLPVDTLKIDQSFVSRITEEPEAKGIVAAVIALAHTLHLRVIAEGVENAEQAALLRQLDCDEAQGFFFGAAVPLAELNATYGNRRF